MAKPVASFNFSQSGLTVSFTDMSTNAPTSWAWTFTGATPANSTDQNPANIVFPASGIYNISLVATNADGASVPFIVPLSFSTVPGLNFTIRQMVLADLPGGMALDTIAFNQTIKKWQLYMQELVTPSTNYPIGVLPEDTFDETKYPPLVNVLIAKLIIWELVTRAAAAAMVSFANASEIYNSNIANVSASTMLVADYQVEFDYGALFSAGQTVRVDLIVIDGISFTSLVDFTTQQELLNYLNSLGKGLFIYSDGTILSQGNNHVPTVFNYTGTAFSANLAFTASNPRVVEVVGSTTSTSSGSAGGLGKGPLKKLETGPSNAEWYDGSAFWANMFKSTGGAAGGGSPLGGGTGIIAIMQNEICVFSRRVRIRLPFCPTPLKTSLFQIARKNKCY